MALTEDIIKAQDPLKGLTDEQIRTIVTLSANDEQKMIDEKTGTIYGALDTDIRETFGIDKQQGEKTYNYLKRAGQSILKQMEEHGKYKSEMEKLADEKKKLEKQVQEGRGNESIVQKLKDTETRLSLVEEKYKADLAEKDRLLKDREAMMANLKTDYEFDKALIGLAFKPEIPEKLQRTLVDAAKRTITAELTPDWIETAEGVKVVWRDKEGKIKHNENNSLNPFNTKELVIKELGEAIMTEKKDGTGTKKPGQKDNTGVSIVEAKTQVEADEIIFNHLMKKGIPSGTPKFDDEFVKIRTEHQVEKLPIR